MPALSLGLDSSTQSITALVTDIDSCETVYCKSLDYLADSRLNGLGLNADYILEPEQKAEANQPVVLYLESLDAVFADMAEELPDLGFRIEDIRVINISGQQHGHVLLSKDAPRCFSRLRTEAGGGDETLASILKNAFSLSWARIWRTSCTEKEATFFRNALGGKNAVIELTGSDAPLRFSAFGIMKTAKELPVSYRQTGIIHQISSLIPAVLCGNIEIPLDYGNACGVSLMDYKNKCWAKQALSVVDSYINLPRTGIREKLPDLCSATKPVGNIAEYFVRHYGFSRSCLIGPGSGDNPQTKVTVAGSLLSLGTSIVYMADSDGLSMDGKGYANAMYDALDRPFMFGCRTNGALCWDKVRGDHGIPKKDYRAAEKLLASTPVGNKGRIFLWQPEPESFPVSAPVPPTRLNYSQPEAAADYAGIIESTLGSVYINSRHFVSESGPLYVAGGAASSGQIIKRIAAIWNSTVVPITQAGAAFGASISGAAALLSLSSEDFDPVSFAGNFCSKGTGVPPCREDVDAVHGENGLLRELSRLQVAGLPDRQ